MEWAIKRMLVIKIISYYIRKPKLLAILLQGCTVIENGRCSPFYPQGVCTLKLLVLSNSGFETAVEK